MSIYNVVNFSFFFIHASKDDKDKTLLKYYAKTIVFDLAYSKQRYQGNQAGNNVVKRLVLSNVNKGCTGKCKQASLP